MKIQSKLGKKSFTIAEQVCHEVNGFRKIYKELQERITLSGHFPGTFNNYGRKITQLSLHFGKLPQFITEKEVNRYLASLARNRTSKVLSCLPDCAVPVQRFRTRLAPVGKRNAMGAEGIGQKV
ncbi:MAG: hypothetical protein NTU44_06960 [Bacteroidetes bacterium]|nr:hypothetical protein [Bacteroidota bacterium]